MTRKKPLFYSAMLLTAVNLALRMAGTVFQVYLSRKIGPEGIGLLQLTMSVGSLTLIAGIGGIRTAAMYLTAEELGRKRPWGLRGVLSGCGTYSILCSLGVGTVLYLFAPKIAESWIGNGAVAPALRLFSCFLPINCLCALMTGFFTGQNRIGTLAVVEVAEQLFSMTVTLVCLHFWAGSDAGRACRCVILGSAMGSCLTLLMLTALTVRQHIPKGKCTPMGRRVLQSAGPLALADTAKSGISTLEHMLVPKRLALAVANPLAVFGIVTGMVFPVLMFPACILFGLSELLIPEMARCHCAGEDKRIRYLLHKSLRAALLYGLLCGGWLFLSADGLCLRLYGNSQAGTLLRWFAPLAPMLYCDTITDAMTKGLGQQKWAMAINIFTSALDVALLFFLLPVFGVQGYFASFLITHVINFFLSIRRLLEITGEKIEVRHPLCAILCAAGALWACSHIDGIAACLGFPAILFPLLLLTGTLRRTDLLWFRRLLRPATVR